jgi:DNA-binding IclR family transcriptional regulator
MPPVRALQRGLDVLFTILDAGEPLRLNEIARRTGLHKATVSRLLGTLADDGYAAHNTVQGSYGIGPETARRFASAPVEPTWHAAARSVLADLRDRSGETVGLFVPLWPDRMCIEQAESRSGLRRVFVIGECSPLSVGSTGRSYLAYVSEAELDTVLRLRPVVALSTNIVRDRAWFLHDMASIRRDGYGLSDDEGIVGMCAMGAPIFGSDDRPIAMIAISGPTGRWTTEARRAFAPTLVQATRKLSDTAAGGSRAAVGA